VVEDGSPVLARRAPDTLAQPVAPSLSPSQVEAEVSVTPEALAERLLGTPVPTPATGRQIETLIAQHAVNLELDGRFLLQYLVRYGAPTQLDVRLPDGTTGWRTVEHGELDGGVLHAWCPAEATYLRLPLSSITRARTRHA